MNRSEFWTVANEQGLPGVHYSLKRDREAPECEASLPEGSQLLIPTAIQLQQGQGI